MGDNILGPGNIIGLADGPADGDLQGNYPGPTVKSLQGVVLSGTPGIGYTLVSTGSSAAKWTRQLQAVAPVSSTGTLVANALNPIEATAGPIVMNLPTGQQVGTLCAIQKYDSTTHVVSVSGSIQGSSHTLELPYQFDTYLFVTDSTGSWWPAASYRTLAGLDTRYVGTTRKVSEVANSGAATTIPDTTVATVTNVVLTANCTLTFPAIAVGKQFTLVLTQDSTGSRTVTWPTEVKWPGGTPPTLTTAAGSVDYFSFLCVDGTHWLGSTIGLNMH
jgi:hypothetical protein